MTCHACSSTDTRAYLIGDACSAHTPAAMAGRAEPVSDPALTLDGLRAAKGLVWGFNPNDTALNDKRAVDSGRRASGAKRRAAHADG